MRTSWNSGECGNLGNLTVRVGFTSVIGGSDQLNHSSPDLAVNSARPRRAIMLDVGDSPLPEIPHCEWVVALALGTISRPSGSLPPAASKICTKGGKKRGRLYSFVRKSSASCGRQVSVLPLLFSGSSIDAFTSDTTPVP
jgi:hypothetical protein